MTVGPQWAKSATLRATTTAPVESAIAAMVGGRVQPEVYAHLRLVYPASMAEPRPTPRFLVGIDTGGTYTDAVLFDEERGVLAKSKALTTRPDLALGIGAALDAVMAEGGVDPSDIGTVALSTTLATNALVEGFGGRVCLVAIGFDAADLERAGLKRATAGDVVVRLPGGHDSFGEEVLPLDLAPLRTWLADNAGAVAAFAVAGRFSVANADHETRAQALIEEATGLPVTCSHALSAKLNGPKRALTAVLNARLVPVIRGLIDAAAALLDRKGIHAPLMIVKGDGSLLSLGEARRRPVETVLSGPAASLAGAGYLSGIEDAIVSDIGGTTTDIGVLSQGRPRLDREGATVAGHATFVEAAAVRTVGLGADSEVRLGAPDLPEPIALGPRRVVPVSLIAATHGPRIHAVLDAQLAASMPPDDAGRFAVGLGAPSHGLPETERDLVETLAEGPVAIAGLLTGARRRSAFARLLSRGQATVAAFCPSDAAHVLGLHAAWDRAAAAKAATLFSRQRTPDGRALAKDAQEVSRLVVDTLVRASAERLLDAALADDGFMLDRPSRHPLIRAALSEQSGLARISARLALPVVGLGASAAVYYPTIARMLGTSAIVPEHADVANAVGAVVGRVRVEATAVVSRPEDGLFRIHGLGLPRDFHDLEPALDWAERAVEDAAREKARRNDAPDAEVQVSRDVVSAIVADREFIFEWRFLAVAVGRPSF